MCGTGARYSLYGEPLLVCAGWGDGNRDNLSNDDGARRTNCGKDQRSVSIPMAPFGQFPLAHYRYSSRWCSRDGCASAVPSDDLCYSLC